MSDRMDPPSRSPSVGSCHDSAVGSIKSDRSAPRKSASRSRSRSRGSRSRSRSYSRNYRKRRSYSRSRSKSRSYSRSPKRRSSRSRSRDSRRRERTRSRSPMSSRRRHFGNRDDPEPSRTLGVFGLSLYTQERELREVFARYGSLEDCNIVYDRQSGRSRGFAFLYFRNIDDAIEAKDRCTGLEIDGRRIRVDYSITKRAHTPTPGIYLGKPTNSRRDREERGGGGGGGYDRGDRGGYDRGDRGDRGGYDRGYDRGYERGYGGGGGRSRRSPSPYKGRRSRYSHSRSRSRSYSPRRSYY